MSLRYRLNKDKFKGKKLPIKNDTNEDLIDPDQRGNISSDDPEFEAIHRFKEAMKKPIEETEFSRRGIFGGLNKLKEFAEDSEKREDEKNTVKIKKKRKKKKAKKQPAEVEGLSEETVEEPLSPPLEEEVATENSEAASLETDTPTVMPEPKQGIFRRIKEHFYPTYKEEIPKPVPLQDRATPAEGDTVGAEELSASARQEIFEEQAHGYLEADDEGRELDRRQALRESIHFLAKPAVDKISGKIEKVNTAIDSITKRPPLLRPPGAISEKLFLQACTRCDDCSNACPKDAIQKVPRKFGFLIMDTPYIDPIKVPCVMCTELPCIPACQEGALMPVPGGPPDVKMGYAILDKKKCQAYGHTFCQQCIIDCPIPGAITQKNDQPTFHKDICTGCGVCVRSCSTVNIPVAIKIKPWMVIEQQQKKKEREQQEAELKAQMEAEDEAEETATEVETPAAETEAQTDTDPDPAQ